MVFDRTLDKDVVMSSAMIVGYGLHGRGPEAITLYQAMKEAIVQQNDATFVGLLAACNHSGLGEEGWVLFHRMREHGIEPRHHHYACVVDLLARAGYSNQAFKFIMNMTIEPGLSVRWALLSACKIPVQQWENMLQTVCSLWTHTIQGVMFSCLACGIVLQRYGY